MKKHFRTILTTLVLGMFISPVLAGEATVEKGKSLFDDPTLGGSTTPAACSGCHPGGKNLEKSGEKENLKDMINMCIGQALKGEPLDDQSAEMESLVLYIKSLGK